MASFCTVPVSYFLGVFEENIDSSAVVFIVPLRLILMPVGYVGIEKVGFQSETQAGSLVLLKYSLLDPNFSIEQSDPRIPLEIP